MEYPPLLLFTYKRLESLERTVTALKNNYRANETELYIFSDGFKSSADKKQVSLVRQFIKTIVGFKSVHIIESDTNKGLANSIIGGVTHVFKEHTQAIILEDDLITSKNFLSFMGDALAFYENNSKIFSISGYTFPFKAPLDYQYDTYIATRGNSWGWATWKDRWEGVNWEIDDYDEFLKNKEMQRRLSVSGSDLVGMLKKQMNGKIDSWAIRWYYHQAKHAQNTVYPVISKVSNDGFDDHATHTNNYNRYKTVIDDRELFQFNMQPSGNVNQYFQVRIQKKFSILTRLIYGKLMSILKKSGIIS